MNFKKLGLVTLLFVLITSCKTEVKTFIKAPNKLQISKALTIELQSESIEELTEITHYLDNVEIGKGASVTINIAEKKLGKHLITTKSTNGDNEYTVNKTVIFYADKKPEIYKYKIINTYPHNPESFTQGLEIHDGYIYEGTGRRGQSKIIKAELETGNVVLEQKLADKYFGEGITVFNDKLYQLTWQSNIGFIYDINTFKTLKTFNYHNSKEGWGLAHNNQSILKTDGTQKIWSLNPETLKEEGFIEVYTNDRKIKSLNEIEYINGKIYANVWQKSAIAIINPKNGAVEGIVNLKSILKELDPKFVSDPRDDVLNGIAYDNVHNKLYITGKHWDKLFEIEIYK